MGRENKSVYSRNTILCVILLEWLELLSGISQYSEETALLPDTVGK